MNAAGAWADEIAALAGLQRIGLQPKRRTAAILPAPDGYDIHGWPVFGVAGEPGYFKPEAGKLLVSPGDATPVDPQDVQPEELDVAILVDWFETKTSQSVRRVERRWAGLRTFAPDNSPVLGEDPGAPWLLVAGGPGRLRNHDGGIPWPRPGQPHAPWRSAGRCPRARRDACGCVARALSVKLRAEKRRFRTSLLPQRDAGSLPMIPADR